MGIVPLILYGILIAAAAIEDAMRLKISNLTNVLILVVGLGTLLLNWNPEWWEHILAFAIALALGIGMYALGWFGGGDAKLLGAAAFAFDLGGLPAFLLLTALAGGVMAILFVGTSLFRRQNKGIRNRSLPYGIAIAAGAMLTFWIYPDNTVFAGLGR
ncbi:MAG TPA: prepilin peptidase [Allosphingosinicella sp.]|nr:prepilin peptidase [Allosphingosinicella sp.]